MNGDIVRLADMRKQCKEFAEAHVAEFCASFNVAKANKMLPSGGKDGAQTNSLDKAFTSRLGKLEHLKAV